MFQLNGFVDFIDEKDDFIFCTYTFPYNALEIGDYIEIDIDRTKYMEQKTTFNDTSIVRKFGSSAAVPSSSTNIITSRGSSSDIVISPSVVSTMGSSQAAEIARHMSRMVDENDKEYEFKIEDNNTRFTYSLICRKQK